MNRNNTWSDEAEARLRELYARGVPVKTIAAEFGRGQNSVIGHAHRMGLCHNSRCGMRARDAAKTTEQRRALRLDVQKVRNAARKSS